MIPTSTRSAANDLLFPPAETPISSPAKNAMPNPALTTSALDISAQASGDSCPPIRTTWELLPQIHRAGTATHTPETMPPAALTRTAETTTFALTTTREDRTAQQSETTPYFSSR